MWDHQDNLSALDAGKRFLCSLEWETLYALVRKFSKLCY